MEEKEMQEQVNRILTALHISHYRADREFQRAILESLAQAYSQGITAGLRLAMRATFEVGKPQV